MRASLPSIVRRVGRALLWLALLLLLARGALALLAPAPRLSFPTPAPSTGVETFPDEEARAFAAGFARAYLSFAPGREEEHIRGLAPYLASGLDQHAGLLLPEEGERQTVTDATVARIRPLAGERALITLALALQPGGRTLYLAVPVVRDPLGRLAVADLPALAPPPARSTLGVRESAETLRLGERAAVEGLFRRFFPAYLAGSREELAYFLRPGARVDPVGGHWSEPELVDVGALARPSLREFVALATVRARDEASGALLTLRYRVALVREGRWYVAAVNDDPKGRT